MQEPITIYLHLCGVRQAAVVREVGFLTSKSVYNWAQSVRNIPGSFQV